MFFQTDSKVQVLRPTRESGEIYQLVLIRFVLERFLEIRFLLL